MILNILIVQANISFGDEKQYPTNETLDLSALFPGGTTSANVKRNKNAFSHPSAALTLEEKLDFKIGQAVFEKIWVSSPSSTTASDGLGPLYNARSCARCHVNNGRGHAPENKLEPSIFRPISLFVRLSIPPNLQQRKSINEGSMPFVPEPTYGAQLQGFSNPGGQAEGQLKVRYETKLVSLNGGQVVTLYAPSYEVVTLGYGPMHPKTMISPRVAPPMIGLGLLDNISSHDLEALADPNDVDKNGISGRTRRVLNRKTGNIEVGRFGWKGGAPTLEQQNAAALFHDIGIGSALFSEPWGDCTAVQQDCRAAPHGNTARHEGLEASKKLTQLLLDYTQHLSVPARLERNESNNLDIRAGQKIFHQIGCADCHRPSFVTRNNALHPTLSEQKIWPYTDLLLHDMGPGLADNRPEGNATGREWRTAPLWGLGFAPEQNLDKQTKQNKSYLHDGRANNLIEAILWHGGEALASAESVKQLLPLQRQQLLDFLESL